MTSFVLQKNMETNGAQLHVDTLAFVQHPFSYFFPLDLTSPPVTWRQCYPREKEPQTFVRLRVGAPMKTFSSLVLQAAADHCALGWDCTWKKSNKPSHLRSHLGEWAGPWGTGNPDQNRVWCEAEVWWKNMFKGSRTGVRWRTMSQATVPLTRLNFECFILPLKMLFNNLPG